MRGSGIMPILLQEDYEYELPKMYKIKQTFPRESILDVRGEILKQLNNQEISDRIKPGMKIAVAVGSRGIRNIYTMVETIINFLKNKEASPYIVSAMGSHGGGTEEGQKEVLAGYGITEENLGVKVITTMDVECLGQTDSGRPVYFDKAALEADMIIPINRIKLHTDFVGPIQSGLCKMLVIGLGNHKGCSTIHEASPEVFAETILSAASVILGKAKVGFGLAIMENSYDETTYLEIIPAEKFIEREKVLAAKAKDYMPFIRIDKADVIVVDEIGKNISGAGFDPNILGRSSVLKKYVLHIPEFQRMVLLNISDESHGNGIGVGAFDAITRKVYEKIDLESGYANAVACKCIEDVKLPLIARDDDEAIRVALKTCRDVDYKNARIIRIKNTLELEYIYVSEALLGEVKDNPYLEIIE